MILNFDYLLFNIHYLLFSFKKCVFLLIWEIGASPGSSWPVQGSGGVRSDGGKVSIISAFLQSTFGGIFYSENRGYKTTNKDMYDILLNHNNL